MDVPASDGDIFPVSTERDHGVTCLLEFSNLLLCIKQILVHRGKRVAFALGVFVNSHVIWFRGTLERIQQGAARGSEMESRLEVIYQIL